MDRARLRTFPLVFWAGLLCVSCHPSEQDSHDSPDAYEPSSAMDAGQADAGTPVFSPDAGVFDAGDPDSGLIDAGPIDAGAPDAGDIDAGSSSDAGPVTSVPEPEAVAPTLPPGEVPSFARKNDFLLTTLQQGEDAGAFSETQLSVLRGRIVDDTDAPIEGALVSVPAHPEWGWTLTRADGEFDLAVNGGAPVLVEVSSSGYLRAQREVTPSWNEFQGVLSIVLRPIDIHATSVNTANSTAMEVVEGATVQDDRGSRTGVLMVPAGTAAEIVMPDGTSHQVGGLTVRITEYTQGSMSSDTMPAMLPPSSAFTYAAEFSADEAEAVGATSVNFSQPVYHYVENFLDFPVGTKVPTGYYDRQRGKWLPSDDGLVIEILSEASGSVTLDTDGDGLEDVASTLTGLGVSSEELEKLAQLYDAGQKLWRVPVPHFTPWDCNFPFRLPADANGPGELGSDVQENDNSPEKKERCPPKSGSFIGCEDRSLGEQVFLPGTGMSFHYQSDRQGAYARNDLTVTLIGSSVPASLKRIQMSVNVAGQVTSRDYTPAAMLSDIWEWDGFDAYGRALSGTQPAEVTVSYWYDGVYVDGNALRGFGGLPRVDSVVQVSGNGMEISIPKRFYKSVSKNLGFWESLGNWSLTPHHAFDPIARVLYRGDGTAKNLDALQRTVRSAAGKGSTSGSSSTTATATPLNSPTGLAVMADGSFYVAVTGVPALRYVNTSGLITGVTPAANPGDKCTLRMGSISDLAYDGANSIYFLLDKYTSTATGGYGLVCKIDLTTRVVSTIAGTDTAETSTCQTGQASSIVLGDSLHGIRVGPDGAVYFSDNSADCVRRIHLDGTVELLLGTGSLSPMTGRDPRKVRVVNPQGIDVTPEGVIYVAGYGDGRVYRIDPDARFTIVAGPGAAAPAPTAMLSDVRNVRMSPEGYLYIAEWGAHRVHRLAPDGTKETIAGGGTGFTELASPLAIQLTRPFDIAFMPDHSETSPHFLVSGAGLNSTVSHRVYRIGRPSVAYQGNELLVPDAEREAYHVFTAEGRHMETRHLVTKALLWSFTYDANGRLATLVDQHGRVTTLRRNGAGQLTAVEGPFGALTLLSINTAGQLSNVTTPEGRSFAMGYNGEGLLSSFRKPDGATHTYIYDGRGRLMEDRLPTGDVLRLAETSNGQDRAVSFTDAAGLVTQYLWEPLSDGGRRTVTFPTGAVRVTEYTASGQRLGTLEDGTIEQVTYSPDARFGMTMPYISSLTRTTPSGRVERRGFTRAVTLSNPIDALSHTQLVETSTFDGATAATDTWNLTARTRTLLSAKGNSVVSSWDTSGRVAEIRRDGAGLTSQAVTYATNGRVASVTQDSGTWLYGYDSSGRLASRQSPDGSTLSFAYDDDGFLTSMAQADGSLLQWTYNPLGQATAWTPPSGFAHALTYTPTGQVASYTAPGAGSFIRHYDAAGRWTGNTFPSGRTMQVSRTADGRWSTLTHDDASVSFAYSAGNKLDRPNSMVVTPTASSLTPVTLSTTMDGLKTTQVSATGPSAMSATFAYNSKQQLTSRTLTVGADVFSVAYSYDSGGYPTSDGRLTFAHAGPEGRPSSTADGATMTMSYAYDNQGRMTRREMSIAGATKHSTEVVFSAVGRVNSRTDTLLGATASQSFSYSVRGELTGATGSASESYSYDANGNRTQANGVAATYSSGDLLNMRGATAYTFDADGFLSARGSDAVHYSVRGELISANIAGENLVYQYDALMRRVARHDASGTTHYYYADGGNPYRLTAWKSPGQAVVALRYDATGHVVALEQAGTTTYVATDLLGSPRAMFDSSGNLLREIRYNAFGERLHDSGTGALAIGFAGGLYDEKTGFVRFGVRDYEPAAGRWTGRDPLLFKARRFNLYQYVSNDPLSLVDPMGLWAIELGYFHGVGAGVKVAFGEDSWSLCVESGFGVGGTVALTDSGVDQTGYSATAEAGFDCVLAGVTAGIDVASPCGELGVVPKLELDLFGQKMEFKPDDTEVKLGRHEPPGADDFAKNGLPKCKAQAKAVVKGCGEFLY